MKNVREEDGEVVRRTCDVWQVGGGSMDELRQKYEAKSTRQWPDDARDARLSNVSMIAVHEERREYPTT